VCIRVIRVRLLVLSLALLLLVLSFSLIFPPIALIMCCMGSAVPDISALKSKMRDAWMAGDFGVIARYAERAEEEFVQRLQLASGTRVLDVACGTGNTAIPAGGAGAHVIGVDIASNLIAQARERAQQAGVTTEFREGDAEQLDFPDAAFDVVISVFGAMFAPRPERVAAELLRVCRPWGTIAMGNWTPAGFVGKMFALSAKHVPPPPGIPAPSMWGDEAVVRQRFGSGAKHIKCARVMCNFRYPFPPADVVKLFRDYFGPTQVAFSKLDAKGQSAMAADLERLWNENNQATDRTTLIPGEYLEVHVVRA
jgi:SAM-dependent methyltransferase